MEGGGAPWYRPSIRADESQDDLPPSRLPPPPGYHNHETYIVQMPRDQVYRVPPPENAHIVESYRKPAAGAGKRNKNSSRIICCCCKFMLALLAILILLAVMLVILFFVFKPTPPEFSVTNLVIKKPAAVKNSKPVYEISLTAKNPNKKYKIEYENNAQVSLLFENKKVGAAKSFPSLLQQPGQSSKVKVEVAGSHETLPAQMEKSMNSKKIEIPISLDLEIMTLPLKINFWVFKSHVACKFKVNTLRSHNIRVLSQECNSYYS